MRIAFTILYFLMTITTAQSEVMLSSFYTDESSYYHKIFSDGFALRLSLEPAQCEQVLKAEIVVKGANKNTSYSMKKGVEKELDWPALYGDHHSQKCWYSGRVTGLNHQNAILYSIKVTLKSGLEFFYNAETTSLIPSQRLSKHLTNWLSAGAMGATVAEDHGVLFKIWEPEAERVDIVVNQKDKYALNTPVTSANIHSLYLPFAKAGDEYTYHFVKNGSYEELEVGNNAHMSTIKIDPMALNVTYDQKGGSLNGYLNPRAIVTAPSDFKWKYDQKMNQTPNSWLIYQLWPLTFNPQKVDGRYQVGTFKDILPKIDYLSDLGVTAVELLPVHESRFHASWGYALDSFTLIEKNYGTSDHLREVVDRLHEKKIKVIFDVVINHINNSLIREPLSKTRQSSKIYAGNTEWGPKPDFDNVMVRKWIADSLLNLIRDYHVDGLRFDMIEHVYKGSESGYKFVQELNTLLKIVNPKFHSSAEQLPDNAWATFPIRDGGLGFDSQWNDKFKNFFELKFDYYRSNNRSVDLSPIVGSLAGFSNHDSGQGEYSFGAASRTVNYLGSHDVVGNKNPFLRIISGFESYESSGKNFFTRVRPLEIPDQVEREKKFRLIHNEFTHDAAMTSYGLLFTKPGAALFFQGEELASDLNIENEWSYINAKENNSIPTVDVDIDRYVRSHRVQWEYLDPATSNELKFLTGDEKKLFTRYHEFFKEMLKFRKAHPDIDLSDAKDVKSYAGSVLSYRLERGPNELFIVVNYGSEKENIWIQFPGTATDWWHETTSLAETRFVPNKEKFLNIISNVGGRSNNVRLAGPSIVIFTKKREAQIKADLFLRTSNSKWLALEDQKLRRASDGGELYSTTFTMPKAGEIEFKLGSADWSIDLGASTTIHSSSSLLEEGQGYLTYVPYAPNSTVKLQAGNYQFLFNITTFKYSFIKL